MNTGSFLVDVVAAAIKKIRDRPKAVARRAAKAARKAPRQRQPDEAAGEFFSNDEVTTMFKLKGKKTYLGIGAIAVGLVLGAVGFGDCDPAAVAAACQSADAMGGRIMAWLNEGLEIGGILLATYGRAKAAA